MKKFLTIVLLATLLYGCDKLDDESRVKDVVTIMDDSVFINYCLLNFDLNNDGAISQTEAKTVKVIEITDEPKLKSVKGISVFSNLEEIHFEKTGLRSIDLSKNTKLTTITREAFYNCSSLTSVTIGNNVTEIGSSAFSGCSSLASVTIPNSVTEIGEYAFSRCSSLTSVTIPDSVTSIGETAFGGCSSLTSVTIPDSVTEIGDWTFSGCTSLTRVDIPDSVTSIGKEAFCSCDSLTSVTIGNGVTSIGERAFEDCHSLAYVFCMPTTPPTLDGSMHFYDTAYNLKIYVPIGSIDKYKTAWRSYSSSIVVF